eukprot:11088365-Karenia_brevis.AAC.1
MVLQKVQDAFAHPVYTNVWQAHGGIALTQVGCWREKAPGHGGNQEVHAHDHLPVLAASTFRYLPVKRALLQRHGIASHWSTTHT